MQYFDVLRIFFVTVDNFLHIVCIIYALRITWIISMLHPLARGGMRNSVLRGINFFSNLFFMTLCSYEKNTYLCS